MGRIRIEVKGKEKRRRRGRRKRRKEEGGGVIKEGRSGLKEVDAWGATGLRFHGLLWRRPLARFCVGTPKLVHFPVRKLPSLLDFLLLSSMGGAGGSKRPSTIYVRPGAGEAAADSRHRQRR